jgi:hypothetical protein
MTIRAQFQRTKLRIMLVALAGFVVFAAGTQLARLDAAWSAVSLAGMAAFILPILYGRIIAFRCPQCHGSLAPLLMEMWWRGAARLRYCPFCGCDIDTEPSEPAS